MNRTNARRVQFAAVPAIAIAMGCVNANPVNYFYGYSQPTLLQTASSSDNFGSQNVSFVQASAPVANIYQSAQPPSSPPPSTAAPQQTAPATTTYTNSYFQSTYANTSSSTTAPSTLSAPATLSASQSGSQQTQSLAYLQATTAASNAPASSGPSATTAAYLSAFGSASNGSGSLGSQGSPLTASYFQLTTALSPLNTISSTQPKLTQVITPFGPKLMLDIDNPEPGTIVLLVGGFGVLFALRRRLAVR